MLKKDLEKELERLSDRYGDLASENKRLSKDCTAMKDLNNNLKRDVGNLKSIIGKALTTTGCMIATKYPVEGDVFLRHDSFDRPHRTEFDYTQVSKDSDDIFRFLLHIRNILL